MRNTVRVVLVLLVPLLVVSGPLSANNRRGIRFGYIESKLDKGSSGIYDKGYTSFYVGSFNDQRIIARVQLDTCATLTKPNAVFQYVSIATQFAQETFPPIYLVQDSSDFWKILGNSCSNNVRVAIPVDLYSSSFVGP